MEFPLVSIIVPMYNTAGCIARCVKSICAQTYKSIEILLLNDGSTDDAIRSAMRLAPGEAMLLLDEVCFNRLCRPVMRSLSYYTNFFDFSILRKLL